MEKIIIQSDRTNDKYYKIMHPSGLEILVWEMPGFSTTEALFGTKYVITSYSIHYTKLYELLVLSGSLKEQLL